MNDEPIELEGEVAVPAKEVTPSLADEQPGDSASVVSPKPLYPWWQSTPAILGIALAVFSLGLYGIWIYTQPAEKDRQQNMQDIASPEPTVEPQPSAQEPAPTQIPSPSASPKPSSSPKPSVSPTPIPSPSPSPVQKANLYYDNVDCFYPKQGGGIATINNSTFTAGNVPSTVTCSYLIQNSETTRTGDIVIRMSVDGKKVYEQTFAPLNKGNWPNSEYLGKSEFVLLDPAVGLHTVTVEMNPDKTFPETNHNDNTFTGRYSVTN